MKLKNISIGDFIEAKNTNGGDVGHDVLEVGRSYEVLGFNEDSDLTVIISVPNHKVFSDGFYVSHEYFRKPKQNSLIERDIAKELLEVDLSSELTGSGLCRAMLARGDKCVLIRMGVRDDKQAKDIGRFAIAISIDESGRFNVMSDQQPITKVSFAVPINNQGEPLTASEVGL